MYYSVSAPALRSCVHPDESFLKTERPSMLRCRVSVYSKRFLDDSSPKSQTPDSQRPEPQAPDSPARQPQTPQAAAESNVERRRRKRAKMSAQLLVRAVNAPTPFEEICKTVDVSRDGILFVSPHSGYWQGQALEVVFPYSTEPSALNHGQPAEVVRVCDQGAGLFAVGIEFAAARKKRSGASPQPAEAGATTAAQPNPAALVLALEPDTKAGEKIRAALQNDGYSVLTVPTAHAALDVLKTTVPAIFVTDLENSDIDGHDFCMIIRRNERLQHVPIVLLARTAQPDFAADPQLGAVVCIAKSDSERLMQLIRLLAPPPTKRSAYGAPVQASAIDRHI